MNTTTLSIEKSMYKRAAKRAKEEHISLSAVARMLLDAYSKGDIRIMAFQVNNPVELRELSSDEITHEIKGSLSAAKNLPDSAFTNI